MKEESDAGREVLYVRYQKMNRSVMIGFALLLLGNGAGWAAKASFVPHELFRVSFGPGRDQLAARVEGGNLIIPRDFTMDGAGHFYITDINNHRISRFSSAGRYEMEFRYLPTAGQLFAHADSRENLWLLLSDPVQGMFYGVYDKRGRSLRSGIFSRFNRFRLHPDDDNVLHVILTSDKDPRVAQTYLYDEKDLLLKREHIARPPETHHQVRRNNHVYFIDQMPGGGKDAPPVNRVTDEKRRGIADIQGTVVYVTGRGEVYTRISDREIHVVEPDGSLKGKAFLSGLPTACASVRFDAEGNIYELDGIPDKVGQYTAEMPGMRVLLWERR